ncbi:glycine cleavage system H protein isoform X3 [Capsicum annuum]|uniref:glycine cleavage system H protein isoform X3 n=1 Tax=Capsicum annuum TaxID=4072 RepID=UPI0007BEAB5A|nr:glycine cleavage system H protein isoform X3 [Capsicum annuum]XP_047263982.1 glycine cleavage system H protein isoform X3 [Capsicum annuum]
MVEKVDVVFNYGGEWVLTPQLTYLKKMTHLWEGLVMKNEFMYTMHMEKFLLPLFGDATGCLTRLEHVVHVHYRETQEINGSPFQEGWIIKVEMNKPDEVKSLMDPDQYTKFCDEEDVKH